MNLRGQVFELDSSGRAGADGLPSAITIRGVTPQGDAAETFTISAGTASWKSPVDAGTASYSAPAFYVSQGGPIDTTAWFLEALLAKPDKSLDLLPGGKARRSQAGRSRSRRRRGTTNHHALGSHRHQHLAVADLGRREQQVLRRDLRPCLAAGGVRRRTIEDRGSAGESAMAAQAPGLAKSLVTVPAGPVAFTGVRLFDADAPRFLTDQTVVVDKGVDHRGRRSRVDQGAGRRASDRRPRQDLDPRPVGLPHAHRRRLHGTAGAVDGRDVGARPGQRRRAHDRPPEPGGGGRAADPRTSIRRRSSTARERTPRRWPTSRPARPRRSRWWTRQRPTASPGSSSTAPSTPRGCPRASARRTSTGCTSTATFQRAFGRSTPSMPGTTRSRTSTG